MGVSFRQESAESIGAPPYGMRITIGSDHRCRGFDSRRTSSQRRRLLKREDNPGDNLPSGFSLSIGYLPYGCCLLGTLLEVGRLSFGYAINLVINSDKPMQNFAADRPTLGKGALVNESGRCNLRVAVLNVNHGDWWLVLPDLLMILWRYESVMGPWDGKQSDFHPHECTDCHTKA